jgi:hypothetical protein
LEFINHHVAEKVLVGLQRLGKALKQYDCESEKVSEVQGVVPSEGFSISLVDRGHALLKYIKRGRNIVVLGDASVLGPIDLCPDATGMKNPRVDLEILHDVFDEALLVLLVIDGEVVLIPQKMNVLSKDADASRMKSAKPGPPPSLAKKGDDPLLHLVSGLVGKGDRHNIPRGNIPLMNEIGDSIGQNAGLATAGASENQKRSVGLKYCLLLDRIQRL